MKKNLLVISSLFFGIGLNAQFTEANSPAVGDNITLYVIDSLAPNFANETGLGAIWDYSNYGGYENSTRQFNVVAPSATAHSGSFASSTEAMDLENFILSYTTKNSSGRESQGFVYSEPTLGEIVATFDVAEKLYNYPFDLGSNEITANFSGNVSYIVSGFPQNSSIAGIVSAKVDGKGTLKLADNDYSNVLRYRLIDTMNVAVPLLGNIQMVRTQYEYYDHSVSNMPVFVHASIIFGIPGDPPMSESSVVLSYENPNHLVGLGENKLEAALVYPNPAKDYLTIQLDPSLSSVEIVITDAVGRVINTFETVVSTKTIDVSSLQKGIYFIHISNENGSVAKSVVIE